ncbi:MAG TPA: hypothetical protein DEV72_19825 [Ktedonobacter sp.]|nr:hypothetical protein [Ktedonobacter sp.]HAT44017.1 hypothetical protein [Ktedonobacter sp.]HBE28392.1 hypothetical protein [Ktedonobacter sp.]HCF87442.1 hypothetical protein [Ktedonobacter sp.]
MLSPQTTYPIPPQVAGPETPPPAHAQQQVGPEFNEQFIEALAQRLVPRLMPEILYHVRAAVPASKHDNPFGKSLALAIVSLALMIPLVAIILGDLTLLGIAAVLIGIGLVCLAMVLVNVTFNIMLFRTKS